MDCGVDFIKKRHFTYIDVTLELISGNTEKAKELFDEHEKE